MVLLFSQDSTRITLNVLKENKSETDISSVKLIRLKERKRLFLFSPVIPPLRNH